VSILPCEVKSERDRVGNQKQQRVEHNPGCEMLVIVDVRVTANLKDVWDDMLKGNEANEIDKRRRQPGHTVSGRVQKSDKDEHLAELQDIPEQIQSGRPEYGLLGRFSK